MGDWEPHGAVVTPWRQRTRGGTGEDRMLAEVTAALPPRIGDAVLALEPDVVGRMESSLREIAVLDARHGASLGALGSLLLRTESVASSKIESIEADIDDYARALGGVRANPSATSMVAATTAMERLIPSRPGDRIDLDRILDAHRLLMAEDPAEQRNAGRVRDVQNSIGGSDHSPRNALYVPPPPDLVGDLLDDLVAFANRDDVPVLAQAAIVHAQFESVHPFTDGNGRVGRALINAVLRRRGATTRVVVPLASALVAHRERYFSLLDDYRLGHAAPLVTSFADGARIAASESQLSAVRLGEVSAEWSAALGGVRRGSALSRLLELMPAMPAFTAEHAVREAGGASSSVYAAIDRLRDVGILRPLTARTRHQIWGVDAVLAELDDLGQRIAAGAR